ncbi:hypothetical protein [Aeromicrobium sp. UC242_57]|uniref:DUF7144 family membrane protein n=1 Tax=Aeromicrobium sp. UC242_57 TaxID=3374624 RepID=UPI0037B82A7A
MGFASGVVVLASVLMMLTGLLQIMQGIGALANGDFYVLRGSYTYDFDVTAWGWVHLVLGFIALVAGLALLSGAIWARLTAITLAVLSIMINFAWLPYFPWWAMSIMVLDVLVIWAVTKFEPYG